MKEFWNERYSEDGFAYGTEPNDFLKEHANLIPQNAHVLCLSEGEGRNAIYLARLGFNVTAVDISEVGMQKAKRRADNEGLKIETIVSDLCEFNPGINKWDAIVSIFGHLPPQLRTIVHEKVKKSLKSGGLFLLEAYTPEQLMLKTGGPRDASMMMSLDIINSELGELRPIIKRTCIRDIAEGKYHQGLSAVIQFVGQKNS